MFGIYRDNKLVIVDSITKPQGYFDVPDSAIGGYPENHYKEGFVLKSLQELVTEGIVELQPTQKVSEAGIILDKSDFELMKDGLEEVPKGFKLGKESLEPKTLDEQLADEEITQEEYNLVKAKAKDRKIVSAIREIYSIDDEYKLINLGIADNQDPEYLEYRKTINDIKSKMS